MSPEQFRACLETIRWPQCFLAEQLGITPMRMRRWSHGSQPIPEPVAIWVRTLSKEMAELYNRNPPPFVPYAPRGSRRSMDGSG